MISAVGFGVPGTAMVGFGRQLSDDQISAVVDFIRTEFMQAPIVAAAAEHGHDDRDSGDMDSPFANGMIGDPTRGRALYDVNCVACHGRSGDGQGPRSAFMERKPRNFIAADAREALNRPHLFDGISEGRLGTEMPAWSKVLSDQDIADIAEFVLQRFVLADASPSDQRHGNAEAGQALFDRHCYFCHGYRGDAETVASAMLEPPPRRLAGNRDLSRATIEAAIRHGRDGTAMVSFSDLLDERQIADLTAFVFERLVTASDRIGAYHTEANGWPDHRQRYGEAFPFVLGQSDAGVPTSQLSEAERQGRSLFLEGCITCHEPMPRTQPGVTLVNASVQAEGSASPAAWHRRWQLPHQPPPAPDDDDHDEEYGRHDQDEIEEPVLTDLSTIEQRGRRLYRRLCAECHAADGSGQNWIGRFLEPNPPSLRRESASPERLAQVIAKGLVNTSMPAFEQALDPPAIDALIAYIDAAFIRGASSGER